MNNVKFTRNVEKELEKARSGYYGIISACDGSATAYTDDKRKGKFHGGWGSVISNPKHGDKVLYAGDEDTTVNKMELTAVLETFRYLISKGVGGNALILVDSMYVANGISQYMHTWQKNGWVKANRKPVLNTDLWKSVWEAYCKLDTANTNVTLVKIKSHSTGNLNSFQKMNNLVDELTRAYQNSEFDKDVIYENIEFI